MTPSIPRNKKNQGQSTVDGNAIATPVPPIEEVLEYLRAFYHGLEVRLLADPPMEWVDWENPTQNSQKSTNKRPKAQTPKAQTPNCIGLSNGKQLIRIESRPSPDGVYSGQLDQNHLFELVRDIVPEDAFRVDHDSAS